MTNSSFQCEVLILVVLGQGKCLFVLNPAIIIMPAEDNLLHAPSDDYHVLWPKYEWAGSACDDPVIRRGRTKMLNIKDIHNLDAQLHASAGS